MVIEEITTTEGLEAIRDEWYRLWHETPGSTPFQTPDWLIPWWRHHGEGSNGELLTISIRQSGRLIGFLPLYIYQLDIDAPRQLLPIGISTSDYLNVLLAPERQGELLLAACAHLDGLRDRWYQWDFPQIREDSPLLSAPLPRGWVREIHPSVSCPVVSIPARANLSEIVPSAMRRNLRSDWRRTQELGGVRIEDTSEQSLEHNFAALLRLHHNRWSSGEKGNGGLLANVEATQANRESARAFIRRDMLRLPVMKVDERIIAGLYGFLDPRPGQQCFYLYLGAFDPSFAQISPGRLLMGHAMEQIAAAGGGSLDFLRGAEPYKYRWGAVDRRTHSLRFWHA